MCRTLRGGVASSPSLKLSGLSRKPDCSSSTEVIKLLKLPMSSMWAGSISDTQSDCWRQKETHQRIERSLNFKINTLNTRLKWHNSPTILTWCCWFNYKIVKRHLTLVPVNQPLHFYQFLPLTCLFVWTSCRASSILLWTLGSNTEPAEEIKMLHQLLTLAGDLKKTKQGLDNGWLLISVAAAHKET